MFGLNKVNGRSIVVEKIALYKVLLMINLKGCYEKICR